MKMKTVFLVSVSKSKYASGNISWKLDSEYENVKNASGIIFQAKINELYFIIIFFIENFII